eukprot:5722530-Pyramimonas_sp.AAC.1
MNDNLPAVLCFERRRAKIFVVLSCIRRAVALFLALNKRLHARRVPSEFNPSDEGSRLFDPKYDPSKALVNSWEMGDYDGGRAIYRRLTQHEAEHHRAHEHHHKAHERHRTAHEAEHHRANEAEHHRAHEPRSPQLQ